VLIVILSPIELSLKKLGLKYQERVYSIAPTSSSYEEAIWRREGHLSQEGPLIVQGC